MVSAAFLMLVCPICLSYFPIDELEEVGQRKSRPFVGKHGSIFLDDGTAIVSLGIVLQVWFYRCFGSPGNGISTYYYKGGGVAGKGNPYQECGNWFGHVNSPFGRGASNLDSITYG